MTTKKEGFINSLWNFCCSLKLTIFLLIGLSAASIIGTIIPQNAPPDQYFRHYGESTIRLFSALNFFDMYHSWWFISLIYLLSLNLVACSVKRLPRDLKFVSHPALRLDEGLEKSLSLVAQRKVSGSAADLRDRMAAFLGEEFAVPLVTEEGGHFHLFAQKQLFSRFGVYVLHFSIIIIFIGAMVGSYFGFKAFVNIEEGHGVSAASRLSGGKEIPLGFTVRCDKFSVSFYDNGAPKEFKSILSVIENGKTVIDRRPIVVNSPLTYKGITFYQASYSPAGDPVFHLTARPRQGGAATAITIRQGESLPLPGGAFLQVEGYTDEIGRFIPQASGPAVKLAVAQKGGPPMTILLLRNYPEFDAQRGGELIFTYDGLDEKWRTGLQVAKDPGVWIVWLGCGLMVLGICMAFFLSHRRIWIRVEAGRVVMGGTANKNQAAFQALFDGMVEKLKKLQ